MDTRRRTRTATDAATSHAATKASADAAFAAAPQTESSVPDAAASGVRFAAPALVETEAGARPQIASDNQNPAAPPPWSRAQAVIGLLTGVLSIAGALYSGVGYLMPPAQGEVAALVRESRTERPLSDATVEVLTPEDTLVTTLAPAADGWTRHSLHAGTYQIRATRPGFGSDTKPIQVLPGRSVEVRFHLTPESRGNAGPVSRFLGRLGL
jgi:hypothetical protein